MPIATATKHCQVAKAIAPTKTWQRACLSLEISDIQIYDKKEG
jgi:hypothetical protein